MKKMPTYILIVVIVAFVVVGGAMAYRVYTTKITPTVELAQSGELPNSIAGASGETKQTSFFSSLFGGGNSAATPTPTPANTADLSKELDTTADDGGASDFQQLTKDASGL